MNFANWPKVSIYLSLALLGCLGFLFESIHSEIWCSPIKSLNGFKFYVIFIDDFSKFTWMYPLHAKSDTFQCFLKFKFFVEHQFNKTIKAIQTDGGGEFTSNHFKDFVHANGIIHRILCPHTSQQNGIVKRKHRHLTETGLSLLAHSSLPLTFWVESFNTVVHLISRMPTTNLHNKSPYELLLNKVPVPTCTYHNTFHCSKMGS